MAVGRLWVAVATRYAQEVELRASPLGTRFWCRFAGGTLVLRMANGVERQIGRDELRAAFRLLDSEAAPETVRMVTASGAYLAAVRDDLGLHGYDPGPLGDSDDADDEEEGALEAILIAEAESRTRAAHATRSAGHADSSDGVADGDVAALMMELAAERAAKEALVREHAGLVALHRELADRLDESSARTSELEKALREASKKPASPAATIGAQADWSVVITVVKRESKRVADDACRRLLEEAAEHVQTQAKLAVVNCRQVLEALALRDYVRLFGAEPVPGTGGHADLMNSLYRQKGIDHGDWSLRKTFYGLLSDIIHARQVAEPRLCSMIVLMVTELTLRSQTG